MYCYRWPASVAVIVVRYKGGLWRALGHGWKIDEIGDLVRLFPQISQIVQI